jgi:hypothetical protein
MKNQDNVSVTNIGFAKSAGANKAAVILAGLNFTMGGA